MPTRPHARATEGGEPDVPRVRGVPPRSVDHAQEQVRESAVDGEIKNGPRANPAGSLSDDHVTRLSGTPGGKPGGRPTPIKVRNDAETQRSLEMENSAATTFADAGYRIKQNPTPDEVAIARQASGDTGDPGRNPDYLIEDRVFDCYSPTNPAKPVRGVWTEVEEKIVEKGQAQRVVVNLEDWRGDLGALRRQFREWSIPGLKEVKIITPEGGIEQIDLSGDG